jgi:plasmid stability protein
MPNLSIKDVPESIAAALRQRAARNHRSLQGELMAIVERAAAEEAAAAPPLGWAASAVRAPRPDARPIEQIAREHLARRPKPVRGGPRAAALLRADRSGR